MTLLSRYISKHPFIRLLPLSTKAKTLYHISAICQHIFRIFSSQFLVVHVEKPHNRRRNCASMRVYGFKRTTSIFLSQNKFSLQKPFSSWP